MMSTILRSSRRLACSWICAPIVAFAFGACAGEVPPSADHVEVGVVGEALACAADLDCIWTSEPICEGGKCVECTVDDQCWWDQVCSNNLCVVPPETRSLYQTCEASSNAQGNCGENMVCLAVGGSTPHCMSAGP